MAIIINYLLETLAIETSILLSKAIYKVESPLGVIRIEHKLWYILRDAVRISSSGGQAILWWA